MECTLDTFRVSKVPLYHAGYKVPCFEMVQIKKLTASYLTAHGTQYKERSSGLITNDNGHMCTSCTLFNGKRHKHNPWNSSLEISLVVVRQLRVGKVYMNVSQLSQVWSSDLQSRKLLGEAGKVKYHFRRNQDKLWSRMPLELWHNNYVWF